jgi:hypothetical protein
MPVPAKPRVRKARLETAAVARLRPVSAFASLALMALLAAGCGAVRASSGPPGLQQQISAGDQAAAATRAAPSQPPPAAPDSASLRAGRRVRGRDVTAIGDSVMSASVLALKDALPGIYIDARPDREMPAGLALLRQLASRGQLRAVVVVGLGTNFLVTTSQLQQLVRLIGPDRRLVLINTYVPDGWSKQVNRTEAAFVRQHPDIVLADWYDTIIHRQYLLWPDHVHPMLPGTTVYARMVLTAVQATRTVTAPSSATSPVLANGSGATPPAGAGG